MPFKFMHNKGSHLARFGENGHSFLLQAYPMFSVCARYKTNQFTQEDGVFAATARRACDCTPIAIFCARPHPSGSS